MAAGLAAAATLMTVAACVIDPLSDPLRAEWRRSVGDPAQACFDFEQASPTGPAGARGHRYSVVASDPGQVTIRFDSADEDGGDSSDARTEAVCALRNGVFSEEDTLRRREHARRAKRVEALMAEFDCLDRKKQLMRAGLAEQARRLPCPR